MTDAISNVSSGAGSGGKADGSTSLGQSLSTAASYRLYHFTYSGDAAKRVDRNKVDVTVEAEASTGKDRIPSRGEASDLDLVFDLAAQNSLKK
jgi:hypothetical protein